MYTSEPLHKNALTQLFSYSPEETWITPKTNHLPSVVGGLLCKSCCCCWGCWSSLHIILLLLGLVVIHAYPLAAVGVDGLLCISLCCCGRWWSSMHIISLLLGLVIHANHLDHLASVEVFISVHIILLLLGLLVIYAYHLTAVGVRGHLCISSCFCWGCLYYAYHLATFVVGGHPCISCCCCCGWWSSKEHAFSKETLRFFPVVSANPAVSKMWQKKEMTQHWPGEHR